MVTVRFENYTCSGGIDYIALLVILNVNKITSNSLDIYQHF